MINLTGEDAYCLAGETGRARRSAGSYFNEVDC